MSTNSPEKTSFDDLVALRYQLYNSLFLTLPFSTLSKYGAELPVFSRKCKESLQAGKIPTVVVEEFLSQTLGIDDKETRLEILFLYLQLVERQILLFDSVERAASPELVGKKTEQLVLSLKEHLPPKKTIRVVLTAHPTQFYPEVLLGLIKDITDAVRNNRVGSIRKLLLQLGRTSFLNPIPPTPLEEAEMLIEHFGNTFHDIFLDLASELEENAPRLELGFWPGGDRDGNPYVTAETTRKVCNRLRKFALDCLINHLEHLHRRITFKGLTQPLLSMRRRLQEGMYNSPTELQEDLDAVLKSVDKSHNGLFREEIIRVKTALSLLGFHFASLDLRQSSDVIGKALVLMEPSYANWDKKKKLTWLESATSPKPINHDLVEVLQLVPEVQDQNGPLGMHRFIVSHTESSLHLFEIFYLSKWFAKGKLDIIPLFETIEDMLEAPKIMEELLSHSSYLEHLDRRGMKQTVMLGFSDGTKDGGYVTCNWEIQKCKHRLYEIAKNSGVEIVFFDGRGGPPARGGGSTHKYYATVAEKLPLNEIQLTVQGQSISSYYGTYDQGKYNLAELLSAMLHRPKDSADNLLAELSEKAYKHYCELREDRNFIPLLQETTPMNLLGELNIASRPPKRSQDKAPSIDNLRAITFVGAWSLMKINLPAFYGFGLALNDLINEGKLEELKKLYKESVFFKVLTGNATQAIRKSYAPLTKYTEEDPKFGELWKKLREELQRTKELLAKIADQKNLQLDDPTAEKSISIREEIVLPLLVIQHHALLHWREEPQNPVWKKLLLKSIPPSINASRNSA